MNKAQTTREWLSTEEVVFKCQRACLESILEAKARDANDGAWIFLVGVVAFIAVIAYLMG